MTVAQFDLFTDAPEREDPPPPARSGALRDYQVLSVKRVLEKLGEFSSTLLCLPTGTGKTRTASEVVAQWGGPVLWLAHRQELIDQGKRDLERYTGENYVSVEKAEQYAGRSRIVVASVQTLKGERLESFARRHDPTLIVIDEAHHAPAVSYKAILAAFPKAKVLGLTATPDRADEKAMGQVFESVAHVYEIQDAIRDKWLCDIRPVKVLVDAINLAAVRTVASDLNQGDLDAVMSVEEVLHGVVKPTLELAESRRTIMFTTSVANAHRMAEIFNRYKPGSAKAVDGATETWERRRILDEHKGGAFQYLCNVGVLTEGYDDPAVSCIGMARPTKSRALYAQCAGRGLRIFPGKSDCLLLDFVGNSGRHALVSGLDILAGKYDDETVAKAKEITERDTAVTASEALEQAAKEIEEARQREAARRAKVQGQVKYRTQAVDPFAILNVADPGKEAWAERFAVPASEKQIAALKKFGIEVPPTITKQQAMKLMGSAVGRSQHGLCTFKQLKVLQRYGIDQRNVSFAKAKNIIDALSANGWRQLPPAQMRTLMGRQPGEEG